MIRAIFQVKLQGSSVFHDLELPAEVGASELAMLISTRMGWNTEGAGFGIYSPSLARLLEPDTTLADAGLWDGSQIIVRPVAPSPAPVFEEMEPRDELAYLVGVATNQRYSLTSTHATLGRSGRGPNFVDLSSEPGHLNISRQHASIAFADGQWTLAATHRSTNAASLNGKRLTRGVPYPLTHGDMISLGGVQLTFGVPGGNQ